jgi:SAM-dependent methyltransferase
MTGWTRKYINDGLSRADVSGAERVASVQQAASHVVPGMRVLEAGSGTGRLGIALARHHEVNVTGIDRSREAIATGERLLEQSGDLAGTVRFKEADMYELPFDAASFDLVLSDSVLEHLDRPEAALAELARVTTGGGVLVLATPNRWRPDGWDLYRVLARPPYRQVSFTPRGLRRLVDSAGFVPLSIFGDELWLERNLVLLRGLLLRRRSETLRVRPTSGHVPGARRPFRPWLRRPVAALLPTRLHVNIGVVARRS